MEPHADIKVDLNSDTFTLEDSQELGERLLLEEIDLRVESRVAAYAGVEGGPSPPDIVIYVLHTLIPVADIYANVLASAIWDRAKSALARQGKEGSVVNFTMADVDDDGNMRGEMSGEIRDPEAIRELIRQFGKDKQ